MAGRHTFLSLAELEAKSSALLSCSAWKMLEEHAQAIALVPLRDLLDQPERYERFSRRNLGIRLDFSRQHLTRETLSLLERLAVERNLSDWTHHLFAGSPVNGTERRAALHTALRRRDRMPLVVNGEDISAAVQAELDKVLALADRLGSGEYRGFTGKAITDVVNIGIGGSDLGLVMATEALEGHRSNAIRCHFVSNIDGLDLARKLKELEASQTLFVICSKSFTTLETQLNADAAREWFLLHLPERAIERHFVAVSVNDAAMDRFGVSRANRFRIWDWVGGRYSLWSAVGLTIAIAIGSGNFRALLEGAAALDAEFRSQQPLDNLPVLLGLLAVWNQNFLGVGTHAVLPYSQALHRFPAYLQQLEMESNGKSVTRDGRPVSWKTGAVIWGEPGSNAQHAFFQLLHQGTAAFSADFVAPIRAVGGPAAQHFAGLANMVAQAEALARGRTEPDARRELLRSGASEADAHRLAIHKAHPGGHPSSVILMDSLDPETLGVLVAMYEHKVFVQSVVWGINAFDQWGVELGKVLARDISGALTGSTNDSVLPPIAVEIRDACR